ncbi:hypothetical protein FRB99_007889 [Tulasnella sp. 403]|nr:hypothetical protein FRB99_007889 [Tulasnella sp. 403]
MTNTFQVVRWSAYTWCIVCAISVLGLAAHQATLFIGIWADRPYIIYALVCSSLTIMGLVLLSLRSRPQLDVIAIGILSILWLALGAYSADIIGNVQCETLINQRKQKDNGGSFPAIAWCREMKAIMAFSFATFGVLLICLIILLALMINLHARGQRHFWTSSMSEIPWFGQYPDQERPVYPVMTGPPPQMPQYSGNVVYQQPGHDVIIENGVVRQVPTGSVAPGPFA